jgi:signal transduction histidine kinase
VTIFRPPHKQKTGINSAGFGLSISKGLIEAHKGKLWLESEPGIGTRAFFTLPLVAKDK